MKVPRCSPIDQTQEQDRAMSAKPSQYIYVLKLIPRLLQDENWTEQDEDIVTRHFLRLKRLVEEGNVILAGRTEMMGEKTFGIVILEAGSDAEAEELMRSDPAVAEGIMTAELYPYRIALMRKNP